MLRSRTIGGKSVYTTPKPTEDSSSSSVLSKALLFIAAFTFTIVLLLFITLPKREHIANLWSNTLLEKSDSRIGTELGNLDIGALEKDSSVKTGVLEDILPYEVISGRDEAKEKRSASIRLMNNFEPSRKVNVYSSDSLGTESFRVSMNPGEEKLFEGMIDDVYIVRDTAGAYLSSFVFRPELESNPSRWSVFQLFDTSRKEFAKMYQFNHDRKWLAYYPPLQLKHIYVQISDKLRASESYLAKDGRLLKAYQRSLSPKIFEVHEFLTRSECNLLISSYFQDPNPTQSASDSFVWLKHNQLPGLQQILEKVSNLVHYPFHHHISPLFSEHVLIRRLSEMSNYVESHDWIGIDDEGFRNSKDIHKGRNRFVTVYIFLNSLNHEGALSFPAAEKDNWPSYCSADGVSISAKAGKAVVYYNMLEDGNVDESSFRRECPVTGQEEKFVAEFRFWTPFKEADF